MTFGVTGSARHCDMAKEMALDHCTGLGGLADQVGLGDNWAHGRFRAPYLRDPLGSAGYAVDTMETAVDWSTLPQAVENIESAIRNGLADEDEQVHAYTHLSHVYGQGSSIRVRASTQPIYFVLVTAIGRPWSAGTSSRLQVPIKSLPVAALSVISTAWVEIIVTIWWQRKASWVWRQSILCANCLIPKAR